MLPTDRHYRLPDYDDAYLETAPIPETPEFALAEIEALKRLRDDGRDAPGPRYIASQCCCQTDNMWMPGGFVCLILMEKLPGITPTSEWYWSLPMYKRDEIRAAFRKSDE